MSSPSNADSPGTNPYAPPVSMDVGRSIWGRRIFMAFLAGLAFFLVVACFVWEGISIGAYAFGAYLGVLMGTTKSEAHALNAPFLVSWILGSIVVACTHASELRSSASYAIEFENLSTWIALAIIASLVFACMGVLVVLSLLRIYNRLNRIDQPRTTES